MKTARAILSSMRPRQWVKNGLVFTGLIFAGRVGEPVMLARSVAAFVVFCMVSGAVYLANDVHDREQDREHETKRLRPVASGALSPGTALASAGTLVIVALGGSLALGLPFAAATAGFLLLQVSYTLLLKSRVILDVMAIAAGFVVRAVAGSVAISVSVSPWLLGCAALLALFLGLGKRRHELVLLQGHAGDHRATLHRYSTGLIDRMLWVVTAATIVAYAFYTFFSATSQRHDYLMFTIPFVAYGLFRYRYLVYRRDLGGSPEEILLTDAPLIADIVLWLAASLAAIYL